MRRRFITAPLSIACLLFTSLLAQAQQRPYRGTYQSVRATILRLENRANLFRNSVQAWSTLSSAAYAPTEDINVTVGDFNDSVRRLRDRFDRRQATTFEVQDVLTRAGRVDDFMRRNSVDARTQNYWSSMRVDLNQLANAYNLSWQTSAYYPPYNNPPYGNQYGVQGLTGTYRIDRSRSDDVRVAAERAARNMPYNERTRVPDIVSRRLDPPDEMAIDVRGRTVTLDSTRAAQISFDADGRERTETGRSGNTVHSRAWLAGNQLTIDSNGDRGNEFHVTFQSMENGRTLVVTRRIYTPELNQSVEVRSTYDKTSDVARFDIYNPQNAPSYPSTAYGNFIVPDGTRIVGFACATGAAISSAEYSKACRQTARLSELILRERCLMRASQTEPKSRLRLELRLVQSLAQSPVAVRARRLEPLSVRAPAPAQSMSKGETIWN